MSNEQRNRLCRSVKWLWMLLQVLILPLAALHAVSTRVRWPLAMPALLPAAGLAWTPAAPLRQTFSRL